jgi:hypothetical protein
MLQLRMKTPNCFSIRDITIAGALGASLATLSLLGGCAAAVVGAGAGAGGEVAYTHRGAEGVVNGNVHDINYRAKSVFKEMGIATTESQMKNSGTELSLGGKKHDENISIEMKPSDSNTTQVEVVAKNGTFSWDQEYAKEILSKIIQS